MTTISSAAAALAAAADRELAAMPEREREILLAKIRFAGSDEAGETVTLAAHDYDKTPAFKSSYLRLGAVPAEHRARLAAYVEHALDPTREPLPPPGGAVLGEDLALRVLGFADDDRRRSAGEEYAQNYTTPAERAARSRILHTLGGWREHTDGNRITTTRGDKVEVIGGDYQLLVLCREPSGSCEAGWDVSGGHLSGDTARRGARIQKHEGRHGEEAARPTEPAIAWEARAHGVWRSTETSKKGDSRVTQHGDSDDRVFGHVQESTTGSELPSAWHEPEACTAAPDDCRANPVIVERTWAEEIVSHTGSEAWPVPEVTSDTFAEELTSEVHAGDLADRTLADSLTSTTIAGALLDVTESGAIESSTEVSGVMSDTTVCARTRSALFGNSLDVKLAPLMVSFTSGLSESHLWGASVQGMVGADVGLTLGVSRSTCVGLTLDVTLGKTRSSTLGVKVDNALASRVRAAALPAGDTSAFANYKALIIMVG